MARRSASSFCSADPHGGQQALSADRQLPGGHLASYDGLRRHGSCADGRGRLPSHSGSFSAAVSRALSAGRRGAGRAGGRRGPVVVAIFEKFTERAVKAVMLSQREARAMGTREVDLEQLFLGLVAQEQGSEGFLRTGLMIARARDAVRSLAEEKGGLGAPLVTPASEIPFSRRSKRVFEVALDESHKMGHNYVAPEHLLVAMLAADADYAAAKVLERLGLRGDKLHAEAIQRLQENLASEGRSTATLQKAAKAVVSAGGSRRSSLRKDKSALSNFCIDITARAADAKVDPVIGRDAEVQRVVQILARRTKNNPILLGEPGVGKTAIAEGLALRIVRGQVPDFLANKRVMSLDLGLLLAGAKERGELETRVTSLVQETVEAGNVVLLIDEVHTLVGSGSVGRSGTGAGLDIANLLKPALARGLLQCIGATTLDEHRKYIEKDKALSRRFQPVMVLEPSLEDAKTILLGLKEKYEQHHRCVITDAAIDAAVQLSARYIADRFLPDKAIDLLDEAGSRARIGAFRARRARQVSVLAEPDADIWQEIRAVQWALELMSRRETGAAASMGSSMAAQSPGGVVTRTLDVEAELAALPDTTILSSSLDDDYDDGPVVVGPEDIAAVASMWSGVPLEQLTADEAAKLLGLEGVLAARVVGQEDAVAAICRAVRRAAIGLQHPGRPIASMLFCGPTGVGKTELTKALARHYFGSEDAMVRLDMSEYMERHSVSKLCGSPPGYVGYGEGGTLTEAVRRRPFTVVLLDEIEKAHPDVFNLLLQIFEDGRLSDSQGRVVSFKNTLIVMTSNIGSAQIARGGGGRIGFSLEAGGAGGRYEALKAMLTEELRNFFRPELLNRLDEVVVFRALERSQVRAIVDIMLRDVVARLAAQHGIGLELSEAAVAKVCDEGYDRAYGARPLRRAIVGLVEDVLSEALLREHFEAGDTALLDLAPGGEVVVARHPKPKYRDHGLSLPVLKVPEPAFLASD